MTHTYPPLHTATDPLDVVDWDEPETLDERASQWAPLFLACLAGFVMAFALSRMGVI